MNWDASTWWWIATGLLVAGELATGTFYVLMLAAGCIAGALASYFQINFFEQALVAAAVGGGSVIALHRKNRGSSASVAPQANPNINLDIGERVAVENWHADGTARIDYRGAGWNVRYIDDGVPMPGAHIIAEVRHNELALRRAD